MDPDVDPDEILAPIFFATATTLVCILAWAVVQLLSP